MSSKKISPEFSKFLLDLREILNRVDAGSEESGLPESEKESFKDKLLDQYLAEFVEATYFQGETWLFKGKEPLLRELKASIAKFFKTDVKNVYVVGSAKTGFSTTKAKDFREGIEGEKNSDIDIAIIDNTCFSSYHFKISQVAHEYNEGSNPIFSSKKVTDQFVNTKDYLALGWIRPDVLFPEEAKKEWMQYFESISDGRLNEDLRYKIRGGLYADKSFLVQYLIKGIKKKLVDLEKLTQQIEKAPNTTDLTSLEIPFKAFLYLMCPFGQGDEKLVHNLVEMMDITLDDFELLKNKFITDGLLKLIGDQIYFEDEGVGREAVNYLINQEKTNPAQIIELSNIYEQ